MHKSVTEKLIAETESYPNLSSEMWVDFRPWSLVVLDVGCGGGALLLLLFVFFFCVSFVPSSVASE
jgi:2-polyprenyl-3-methyl-5-hydroxy-6-metoxy-1,4-benzoquinol methylase